MIGKLVHDRRIHILDFKVRNPPPQHIQNLANGRIDGYDVVYLLVEMGLLEKESKRAHRVAELEIGPLLIQGRSPNRDRKFHHGLPAEFIDGGMESHSHRPTENGPK